MDIVPVTRRRTPVLTGAIGVCLIAVMALGVASDTRVEATRAQAPKHIVAGSTDVVEAAQSFRGWIVPVPRRFQPLVATAAKRHSLPANILAAVLRAESAWKPNAVGDQGRSYGLAQINTTAWPISPRQAINPRFAIDWTAYHLSDVWQMTHGNVVATVLFHNCPACSYYYWRTGRFGPGYLADDAARYAARVFGQIGGTGLARRLTNPVVPA